MHFTRRIAKYPIQVGILAIALLAVMAWSSKRPALGSSFSHKRPTYDQPHLGTYQYTRGRLN